MSDATFDPAKAPIDFDAQGHDLHDGLDERLRSQVEIGLEVFGAGATYISIDLGNCCECDEYFWGGLRLRDGRWVFESKKPACPFPGGMPAYETLIDVPSGVLVIGGDLRQAWPEVDTLPFNICRSIGQKEQAEAFAAVGMTYVMARGNNMQASTVEGGLLVGTHQYAEDADGNEVEHKLPGTACGRVRSNGLRAVCAADLDTYERKCREHGLLGEVGFGGETIEADIARVRCHFQRSGQAVEMKGTRHDTLATLAVKVEPGRYRVTHLRHTLRGAEAGAEVYARFERI